MYDYAYDRVHTYGNMPLCQHSFALSIIGQRTRVPNTIQMKVVCHIIPKMGMVLAEAGDVEAVVVVMVVDVVAVTMADMEQAGTMVVALLPPVIPTCHKDAPICRWIGIPTMTHSFYRIT